MIDYEKGQIVKSLAGRESGKYFLVVDYNEDYLWLVDGETRRLEAPKKKKKKHVQITHEVIEDIAEKLIQEEKISNAEIRKSLKQFLEEK